MDAEMGPNPSSAPIDGKRLTDEDQRERLSHFQREGETGSPEDNLSAGHEQLLAENVARLTVSSENDSRSKVDNDQPKNFPSMVENKKSEADSSAGEYFNLTNSQSSYVVSAPASAGPMASEISSGDCCPKPLSSTTSTENSQSAISTKVSETKLTAPSLGGSMISHGETKELQENVKPKSDASPQSGQLGDEGQSMSKGKNPISPLTSREDPGSICDSDDESDDEFHDILILCDSNDKKHLEKFEAICDRNKWSTTTKNDFPFGDLQLDQLEEVMDKCMLVVTLITSNSLNQGQSNIERHSALFKSIQKQANSFIPVVCEEGLQLPSYIKCICHGRAYEKNFEKQMQNTMKKQKKKKGEQSRRNLPPNCFDSPEGEAARSQQPSTSDTNL